MGDPDPQTKKVYTRLVTVDLSDVASGRFTTAGVAASYNGYNSVFVAHASWVLITNGSQETVANSPTFNDYLPKTAALVRPEKSTLSNSDVLACTCSLIGWIKIGGMI